MTNLPVLLTAMAHALYGVVHPAQDRAGPTGPAGQRSLEDPDDGRDRGAISLEQVLWFVAAGVSVVVIAAIIWNQIREQAETPVQPPSAP